MIGKATLKKGSMFDANEMLQNLRSVARISMQIEKKKKNGSKKIIILSPHVQIDWNCVAVDTLAVIVGSLAPNGVKIGQKNGDDVVIIMYYMYQYSYLLIVE